VLSFLSEAGAFDDGVASGAVGQAAPRTGRTRTIALGSGAVKIAPEDRD